MNRKELVFLMVMTIAVNYIGRTAMAVAGPDIARQYGFSEVQLGQIFSAFWLGYGLMMWPSGWLADKYGAGRVLGIFGLVTGAALAGNAVLTTLAGFLVLRLLFGVASAATYPGCGNLTMRNFPDEQVASVQGLVGGGSNLGAAVAPLLVLWASRMWGWRGAFIAVAMVTLLFFLWWMVRVPNGETRTAKPPEAMRLNRTLVLLSLQYFAISYFYSFGDTWSFYYFREVRHFPEEQSALFATLLQVAGGVMMPLGGWLSDLAAPRLGRLVPAFLALCGAAVCLAVSIWMVQPMAVLAFVTASYSLVVVCEGVFWWAVLTKSPESPGAAYGIANAAGSGAQFVAPLTLPWIAGRWGWDAAVLSVAAVLVGSAVLWRYANKSRT